MEYLHNLLAQNQNRLRFWSLASYVYIYPLGHNYTYWWHRKTMLKSLNVPLTLKVSVETIDQWNTSIQSCFSQNMYFANTSMCDETDYSYVNMWCSGQNVTIHYLIARSSCFYCRKAFIELDFINSTMFCNNAAV